MMTILSFETKDIPDGVKIKVHAKIIKRNNGETDGFKYLRESCPIVITKLLRYVGSMGEHSFVTSGYEEALIGMEGKFKTNMISMHFLLICFSGCCWDRTKPRTTLPVKADNKKKVVMLKTPEPVKIPELYKQIYKTIVLSVKS
ncbi:BTB/POZ and MATH domain-containing protein 2-like [Pyrus ussuriensis x Pyrus communis]|uniref:BTB/POZ and MATH domain-containing protein 2-like n=1 Tax=Pyrus ussuriensis x Pyrus communis TaxID=2448454 RepID=A0A5N5I0E6_9ROSA|nr:BTB/POZ and MATH domain-containing protein 2-like [Pyrus ussuriensis x Pyrus communis]